MKIPGLDEITSNLKELPEKTDEIVAVLGRIEALLTEFVDVQMPELIDIQRKAHTPDV